MTAPAADVRRRLLLAGAVALLVAGTVGSAGGAGVSLVHQDGRLDVTDGQFHMNGTLVLAGDGVRTARDVRVVLYDERRRVIATVPVGTLSTDPAVAPQRRQVAVTSDRVPAYVLLAADRLWRQGPALAEGFVARERATPSGPVTSYTSYTRRVPGERFPDDE